MNHLPFGRALHRFLQSNGVLALLPGCGWLDGGCLILREALVQWGSGELSPGVSARTREAKSFVDHGFAWLDLNGQRIILDGDGVQDEEGLQRKLELLEGVRPSQIHFGQHSSVVAGILVDQSASTLLADRLSRRFGRFSPDLISK